MNIHEYQAKEILKNYGLPVLKGKSYNKNLETLDADIKDLKGPPWVVKSQIHAGGRGAGKFLDSGDDKGGVRVCFSKEEAKENAKRIIEEAKIKSSEIIKRKEDQAEQKILALENDAINNIKKITGNIIIESSKIYINDKIDKEENSKLITKSSSEIKSISIN